MTKIRHYRDLDVWQRAVDISVKLYKYTENFPQEERYGITIQMRRAVVSIASNIAEGHGRPTRDFARFLTIARGSLAELETQLEISRRIGYLPDDHFNELTEDLSILGRQLNALLNKIKG